MVEIPGHAPEDLLRATVFSLEAEYRAYRRAAEQYHAKADQDFQLALNLLLRGVDVGAPSITVARPGGAPQMHSITLTTRETQVLKLIASGNSTKQAAFILGIKFKTAVGHRSQLMKKLQIHDTASLVRFAIRAGLVDP